jgi:NAD(P)-dependent dehydrogenase (short-subunit alcohol dehydrogenase family)
VVPKQHRSISVLTNAVDVLAHPLLDGVLRILKAFSETGVPDAALTDWAGRWWSVWGAGDLVPMRQKVVVASVDVTDLASIEASLEAGIGRFGGLNAVINDAGVSEVSIFEMML